MSLKTLMVVKAAVCLMFGIGFIFVPERLLSIFGAALSDGGTFPAREYGAALFGNMVLTWNARNASASEARTAIIQAMFVYDAIGVVVTLLALFGGLLNSLGWLVVVVYLFFTLGYGYFLVGRAGTGKQVRGASQGI